MDNLNDLFEHMLKNACMDNTMKELDSYPLEQEIQEIEISSELNAKVYKWISEIPVKKQ